MNELPTLKNVFIRIYIIETNKFLVKETFECHSDFSILSLSTRTHKLISLNLQLTDKITGYDKSFSTNIRMKFGTHFLDCQGKQIPVPDNKTLFVVHVL